MNDKSIRTLLYSIVMLIGLFPGCKPASEYDIVGKRADYFPVEIDKHYRYIERDDNGVVISQMEISFDQVSNDEVILNGSSIIFGGFDRFKFSDSAVTVGPDDFPLIMFPLQQSQIWDIDQDWDGKKVTRFVTHEPSVKFYVGPGYYDPFFGGGPVYKYFDDCFIISTEPVNIESLPTTIWLCKHKGIVGFKLGSDRTFYLVE